MLRGGPPHDPPMHGRAWGEVRGAMAAPSVCGLQGFTRPGNRNFGALVPRNGPKTGEQPLEKWLRNARARG
jgi:hypothetical protein